MAYDPKSSDDVPIYFCYVGDRGGGTAHVIASEHLTEIPSGNIETAYRFVCGDEYLGYHTSGELWFSMTEQQLSSSDIQLCQACQKSELYAIKTPQQISSVALWVLDIEREMVKHFTLHPVEMYLLHPRKFEELIAAIFRNQGFQVELTPQTRDGGCDFIAIQNHVFTGNLCYLVECKRNAPENRVGVAVVRSLHGVVTDRNATKGILVTTSSYTNEAKRFGSRHVSQLALQEYDDIVTWLQLKCPSR